MAALFVMDDIYKSILGHNVSQHRSGHFMDLAEKPGWIPIVRKWVCKILQRIPDAEFASIYPRAYHYSGQVSVYINSFEKKYERQQLDLRYMTDAMGEELRNACTGCGARVEKFETLCQTCKP